MPGLVEYVLHREVFLRGKWIEGVLRGRVCRSLCIHTEAQEADEEETQREEVELLELAALAQQPKLVACG